LQNNFFHQIIKIFTAILNSRRHFEQFLSSYISFEKFETNTTSLSNTPLWCCWSLQFPNTIIICIFTFTTTKKKFQRAIKLMENLRKIHWKMEKKYHIYSPVLSEFYSEKKPVKNEKNKPFSNFANVTVSVWVCTLF
jgi:hypothetical protein